MVVSNVTLILLVISLLLVKLLYKYSRKRKNLIIYYRGIIANYTCISETHVGNLTVTVRIKISIYEKSRYFVYFAL